VIAEDREESSFIWENYYCPEEKINRYDLALFIRQEDGRYVKKTETHFQKAYSVEKIKKLLSQSGMELLEIYDAFSKNPPENNSDRIYFIAKEKGKEIKNV
jgi:hypothetical protein